MRKIFKPVFWTFLFLVMMLAIDQFFVQVPSIHPAHATVSNFYNDFRGRLIDLAFGDKKSPPKSIEAVIEKEQKEKKAPSTKKSTSATKPARSTQKAEKKQRYLYSDSQGELHFADSLDEVPEEYRNLAQPMGQ